MLGKRKRDTQVVSREKAGSEDHDSMTGRTANTNDVFRQYFEAQFAPLPEQHNASSVEESEDESVVSENESDISEWSGISDTGDPVAVVEVVDHVSKSTDEKDEFHRARQKAFMVGKHEIMMKHNL